MVRISDKNKLNENEKSSRHQKITGDFGETVVLYWLSKHGYECALIDHTGIDILASKKGTVIGISVKTRSRTENNEFGSVHLLKGMKTDRNDEKKLLAACKAFKSEPYFAVVVDGPSAGIRGCLISYKKIKRENAALSTFVLKMTTEAFERYKRDKLIRTFQIHLGQNW
jgi:Holliday junction resolvase-like predicted endonuclease